MGRSAIMNAMTTQSSQSKGEPKMKQLIPLMVAMGLTLGAVTAFSHSKPAAQKSSKATRVSKKATKS
jgi:hypothetical protein